MYFVADSSLFIGAKPVSEFMKAFKDNLEKEARNSTRK